jgi:thiol-disulfide isomerase/thioredoxin
MTGTTAGPGARSARPTAGRRAQPARRSPSGRARRKAAAAVARRRRWGLLGAGGALVALAAAVLGLHFASTARASSGAGPSSPSGSATGPAVGETAPAGTFTTLSGHVLDVASLRGHPTLLWFVSTWCSSCQAGTVAMAHALPTLEADGVRVDEIELYEDLGQSGPSMRQFARALAGPELSSPAWTFGVSSASLTRVYDPRAYLDIYYLLDANGRIVYVNGSPAATMSQLLAAAKSLS